MLNLDIEQLKKWYYDEKLPIAEISRRFKCCAHTIYKTLEKHGLSLRPKLLLVEDVTGQKFNKLTFLKYIRNDKFGKAIWLCRCDCGREKELNASAIKAKLTTSCGCHKRNVCRRKGYELISWGFYRKLKKSALSRDYDFDVSMPYLWDLFCKQDRKCALTGINIVLYPDSNKERLQTASLDRIDSNKGYVVGNVQWVHKRINRLKNILSTEELVFWCRLIVEKNANLSTGQFDVNLLTWD
jgi:hypothetical protein